MNCLCHHVSLLLPQFSELVKNGYKIEWKNEHDRKRLFPLWCWHQLVVLKPMFGIILLARPASRSTAGLQ